MGNFKSKSSDENYPRQGIYNRTVYLPNPAAPPNYTHNFCVETFTCASNNLEENKTLSAAKIQFPKGDVTIVKSPSAEYYAPTCSCGNSHLIKTVLSTHDTINCKNCDFALIVHREGRKNF